MKIEDAKALVKEYHNGEASKELEKTFENIMKIASRGETTYFTYFNYEKNVQELKDRGFTVTVRSKTHDESQEKYVVYYDISWREDV